MSRYRTLIQRLGHQRWFATVIRRAGARVDRTLYRLTRGRLSIAGPAVLPVLLLTTTGRRSGRLRTTPVIYVRDRARLVISSESFGHARPAAWPLNLAAEPIATVQLGATTAPYRRTRRDRVPLAIVTVAIVIQTRAALPSDAPVAPP